MTEIPNLGSSPESVLSLRQIEFAEAVYECQRVDVFTAISPGPMTDGLGVVVHGFDQSVVYPEVEIGQDAFFMASEHPGEVAQWFDSAVGCPPEPPFEILGCPALASVLPQFPKEFFEQISFDDLEVALQ